MYKNSQTFKNFEFQIAWFCSQVLHFGSTKSLVVDTSEQLVYTSTSKTSVQVAPGKLANWNEWSKPTSNIPL